MSDAPDPAFATLREALGAYPPPLLQDFEEARAALAAGLSPPDLRTWAEIGLAVARHSLRSWEAAGDYFRVSGPVMERLAFNRFQEWARTGLDLTGQSPALAAAYFRASPEALQHLAPAQVADWGAQGRVLYKGTWKSGSLAAQYFEVSPQLLPRLPLGQSKLLVELVDTLAGHSYELAGACLGMAPAVLQQLDRADRAPFLEFGSVVANTAWADARHYFEQGPAAVRHIHPALRARFLALAGRVALRVGRQGHPYFLEAAHALAEVDRELHHDVVALAEGLMPHSGVAAMEFVKVTPAVLQRLDPEHLPRWQEQGLAILQHNMPGGEAFFRLESAKGEEIIEALSSRLELDRVSELIRLYCRALVGSDVAVHSSESLADRSVGWISESSPTTEGTAIFLPASVEEYDTKEENFAVYKVFATHQAGRLEFESFDFHFDRAATHFPDARTARPPAVPDSQPLTDMERFFDLFPDRRLAADLFTIVEDTRIDAVVKREYPGIRRAFERLQRAAVEKRRPVENMPAREAMVENMVRASLDEPGEVGWPEDLAGLMQTPLALLAQIRAGGATVQDSAEAALRLYDWIVAVPNVELETLRRQGTEIQPQPEVDEGMPSDSDSGAATMPAHGGFSGAGEQPYQSPDPVDFRGEFKPELVQLMLRLRAQQAGDTDLAPITPEQLEALLEKSVEISLGDTAEGDLSESAAQLFENLMEELAASLQQQRQPGLPNVDDFSSTGEPDSGSLTQRVESFYYDEWDFRANDYKPRWCRVQEQRLERGTVDYYNGILAEHSASVQETRKQFELLKPELFRKIKRLPDGEDYDLDAVIEWRVDRVAGAPTDGNLFYKRNKVERDVAVAFLLDMSASTDEEIHRHRRFGPDDPTPGDSSNRLTWWAHQRAQDARQSSKRIIDLEKEAIVLLVEALETIGDRYGVFGFSGYGRDNVEFYVLKDLDEPFSDHVKRRIDKVSPVRSTRMGPAIRHCIAKLNKTPAKVRILVLLSDGRPQDHGYGRDRTEKEYAIHDTRMALIEARRAGMTPFCLTVDRQGHDYLKQMCEDMSYEVVADIESLPRRLPSLYRRLTR